MGAIFDFRQRRLSDFSEEDIRFLLKRQEDEQFDRTLGEQDNIGETMAQFATKNGGLLLIGQKDFKHGGEVVGIDIPLFQSEYANAKRDVKPAPYTESKLFEIDVRGKRYTLALILVLDLGKLRPCSYRGVYYDRDGDQKRKLTPEEVRDYHLRYGTVTAEDTPTKAAVDDLDPSEIDLCVKKFGRKQENLLESLVDKNGAVTTRGVIALAKKPDDFIEGAFIEIQKYGNPFGAPPIAIGPSVRISKPARQLIEAVVDIIQQNLPVTRAYEGAKMIQTPAVPLSVIRESVTNAVAHRNYQSYGRILIRIYDDGFDVSNPAVLTQRMWEDIRKYHGTYRPNEGLYKFLNSPQLYEARGEGIQKIIEEMEKLGKMGPEFKVIGDVPSSFYVRINLSPARAKDAKFQRLNRLLETRKSITTTEVMKRLSVSRVTAIHMLNDLVNQGILDHKGSRRSSYYIVKYYETGQK